MITKEKLPKYILFGGKETNAMVLRGNRYYRHAGNYSVGFNLKNGRLFAKKHIMAPHFSGVELIPTTKAVWKKSNKGYIK